LFHHGATHLFRKTLNIQDVTQHWQNMAFEPDFWLTVWR
jgi:hypothetical protein